jgi:hypothetical protein
LREKNSKKSKDGLVDFDSIDEALVATHWRGISVLDGGYTGSKTLAGLHGA